MRSDLSALILFPVVNPSLKMRSVTLVSYMMWKF